MLDAGFRSERLRLSSGDRLLLYTDGVTEAANDSGEEFGAERLARILDGGTEPLPQQWHAIMDDVREHANGNFTDDATLLLISVPAGQHSSSQMVEDQRADRYQEQCEQ